MPLMSVHSQWTSVKVRKGFPQVEGKKKRELIFGRNLTQERVREAVTSPYRAQWSVEGKVSRSQPHLTWDFVLRWPRGNERFRIKTSLQDHGWQHRSKTATVGLCFDISSVIQLKQSNFPSRSWRPARPTQTWMHTTLCRPTCSFVTAAETLALLTRLFNPNHSDRTDAFRDVTYSKCFKLSRLEWKGWWKGCCCFFISYFQL